MYFKEKWRSTVEKEPLPGGVDVFRYALIKGVSEFAMNKFSKALTGWRFWWALQGVGMLIIALCATFLPLFFPALELPLRIIFLWILPLAFGAWSAYQAVCRGLISYAAWLLPPMIHSVVPWIGIGYPPAPLSMLLCAFISLIGAAAGDVMHKQTQEK